MSHTPRQLNPIINKKRDETTFDFLKPSNIYQAKLAKPFIPRAGTAQAKPFKPARPPSDNKLLAGYLAHEFLNKGTLFGQPWDPARADAVPVSAAARSDEFRKPVKQNVGQKGKPSDPKPGEKRKFDSYAGLSGILMGKDGAYIPGIVNPTQLARFLNQQ
uniref:uncharacterized protein LOC122582480 n=1 Tax=Erigeron canadensis TaxID=72917 RepID=UPI001CB95F09|nr:uncharacterized protein LOC122582480 [Erigeron canadensis]